MIASRPTEQWTEPLLSGPRFVVGAGKHQTLEKLDCQCISPSFDEEISIEAE
jgi:hypothetical protein